MMHVHPPLSLSLSQLIQPYTHLDLLAPMPDVELDKPRLLMVEGGLHYRDHIKPKVSCGHLTTEKGETVVI